MTADQFIIKTHEVIERGDNNEIEDFKRETLEDTALCTYLIKNPKFKEEGIFGLLGFDTKNGTLYDINKKNPSQISSSRSSGSTTPRSTIGKASDSEEENAQQLFFQESTSREQSPNTKKTFTTQNRKVLSPSHTRKPSTTQSRSTSTTSKRKTHIIENYGIDKDTPTTEP